MIYTFTPSRNNESSNNWRPLKCVSQRDCRFKDISDYFIQIFVLTIDIIIIFLLNKLKNSPVIDENNESNKEGEYGGRESDEINNPYDVVMNAERLPLQTTNKMASNIIIKCIRCFYVGRPSTEIWNESHSSGIYRNWSARGGGVHWTPDPLWSSEKWTLNGPLELFCLSLASTSGPIAYLDHWTMFPFWPEQIGQE